MIQLRPILALQSAASELRLLARLSSSLSQAPSDLQSVSLTLDTHVSTLLRDNARLLPVAVPYLQLQVCEHFCFVFAVICPTQPCLVAASTIGAFSTRIIERGVL